MQMHQSCWLDIMQWGHANSPAILVRHNGHFIAIFLSFYELTLFKGQCHIRGHSSHTSTALVIDIIN